MGEVYCGVLHTGAHLEVGDESREYNAVIVSRDLGQACRRLQLYTHVLHHIMFSLHMFSIHDARYSVTIFTVPYLKRHTVSIHH